jgi:hypothetical protein
MPLSLMHFVLVIFTRNFKSMIDGEYSLLGRGFSPIAFYDLSIYWSFILKLYMNDDFHIFIFPFQEILLSIKTNRVYVNVQCCYSLYLSKVNIKSIKAHVLWNGKIVIHM